MPRLILEARRVAATVIHGLHGRRRAGTGENFWQFRRFMSGEPAARVDWRRSARDDHLYVREREWEAAHTVWIWPDRSPSMVFASPLVWETKLDRALVVAFALAEVLVEGGERVGIPGHDAPERAAATSSSKMAEAIVHDPTERASLPPSFAPSPLSEVVVLSDLWSPIAEVRKTIAQLSANGAHGHVVQVVDPAEETFPFSGRVEFVDPEDGHTHHGRPRRSLARGLPEAARAASRRNPRRDRPARLELHHSPHRPAGERTAARAACAHGRGRAATGVNRWHASAHAERRMIGGLPLGFAQPLVLLGLLSLPVLWWLLRLVPPRPRRQNLGPEKLLLDILPKEETPVAHAVVADAAAPHARRAADHRGRGPAVESAARDLAGDARRSRC